jgi:adenylate cyclase
MLVIARNTAVTYKGKAVNVRQVGRDLGVRFVLEGTVRRSGDQVHLIAQLSDARTGARLWVERIDGSFQHAGVLDHQITSRVARTLGLQLAGIEAGHSDEDRPTNPNAVELAMRGWALMHRPRARDNTLQAVALFEDALRADPDNISAALGLGRAYYQMAVQRWTDDPAQSLDKSDQLARRTAILDPSNGRPHRILSDVLQARKQPDAALVAVRRAVELNPSDAGAWGALGFQLLQFGRFEEALEPLQKALQISPRDPLLWSWTLNAGLAHCALGNDAVALDWARRAVQANPQSHFTHLYSGAIASLMGRPDEAQSAVAEYVRLRPEGTISRLRKETSSDEPRYLALRERLYGGLRTAGLPD